MKKIIIITTLILFLLISCENTYRTTGQVGPSRGIVFEENDYCLEAMIYQSDELLSQEDAKKACDEFAVESGWNKWYSDFRLPTESELLNILNSKYFFAVYNPENYELNSKFLWTSDEGISINYQTKEVVNDILRADIIVVREIKK